MSERRHVVSKNAPASDAATAFAQLTDEVALLRRAVEDLRNEKAGIDVPDYAETLGEMAKRLGAIEDKPALRITPEDMAARIGKAAEASRRTDAAAIGEAREGHRRAVNEIRSLVGAMRGQREQRQHLLIAIAAGCLIWSILPGLIARTLPDSWYLPERMARRMVGEPSLWEAGGRMMRAENANAWAFVIGAAEIRRQNRDAIDACEKKAARARKAVRCTINMQPRA